MEKGSVLPSPPMHAKQLDEKVKGIPLPTQLPKGVDFSEIPMAALKSATLESLLSQNEDLMARLSVALRKIHELESAATAFDEDRKSLATRFQTLKDQFLVLQEKDRSATQRNLLQYEENLTLRQQGEKIERLYADLYRQAQALQKRLQRLERYRAKVRKAAAPLKKRAKLSFQLEREILIYRQDMMQEKEAINASFAAQLESASQETAALRTRLNEQQMQIVNAFEAKLAAAQQELLTLRPKADERDQVYENLMKSENQRIHDQRQFEQVRAEADQITEQLRQETAGLRVQVKELLIDRESKTQELTKISSELPHLRERNQALFEQVESLQALWNHKQKELEQSDEKYRSLQKLNQNLSVNLNQQRKEIHQLQAELDKERFQAQEKIKTLVLEIQMLRSQLTGPDTGATKD